MKRINRFFLLFQGIVLRRRLTHAFDRDDARRMYAISRKIDALQKALILEAGEMQPIRR